MRNQIDYSKWTFSDDGVSEGGCYLEQSLPSTALGYNTLEATVRCPDRDILNFTLNAPLTWRYRGQIQAILYVQSILRVGPDLYAISAISAVGRLASMPHPGGVYTGQLVEAVVPELCGDVPVIVKTNLRKIPLYGWLPYAKPPEKSARDNLAQILFSIGASLGTDLDGVLRVEPLWDGISNVVDADRMYQDGTVETEAAVSAVTVTEHQYTAGGETETLFEGNTEEGHLVIFDAPHSDLTANGFAIRASGANWARLSAGAGTLTGRAYVHTTRMLTESVTSGAAENIQSVSDCTMISLFNSTAAVRRMAAYYGCRTRIDVPILVHTVRPGQRISILNPYDRVFESGVVASMDVTMSGVLKGQTQVVMGYVPPQPDNTEYFNYHEVLTEDTDFQFPEGVTSALVVLGSGGTGGWSGLQGNPMSYPPPSTSVKEGDLTWSGYNTGYGAEGGEPGQPGSGGKVLQVNIPVQPDQIFAVRIGKGGKGGIFSADGSVAGAEGGATTFGSYSSADGGVLPGGYQDILTGQVYSAPSQRAGIAGGKGSGLPPGATSGYETGPDVVDYEGNVWHAGPISKYHIIIDGRAQAMRGNGGGAAVGCDGQPGSDGRISSSGTGTRVTAIGGAGGIGGDAVKPARQTRRGWGGDGGHGGGGEGGSGAAAVTNTSVDRVSANQSRPGYGSDGGDGGDGYVIVYYTQSKTIAAGQLVTSDKKFFFDRLGRIFVV